MSMRPTGRSSWNRGRVNRDQAIADAEATWCHHHGRHVSTEKQQIDAPNVCDSVTGHRFMGARTDHTVRSGVGGSPGPYEALPGTA